MAATPDMAPDRTAASGSPSTRARTRSREEDLGEQIAQLQSDMKAIASTLAGLAEDKVGEAQSLAKREAKNLANAGQHAVEDVQDEFSQLERQLKDTIRDKPLTAVAGAIALGYILAVISR